MGGPLDERFVCLRFCACVFAYCIVEKNHVDHNNITILFCAIVSNLFGRQFLYTFLGGFKDVICIHVVELDLPCRIHRTRNVIISYSGITVLRSSWAVVQISDFFVHGLSDISKSNPDVSQSTFQILMFDFVVSG